MWLWPFTRKQKPVVAPREEPIPGLTQELEKAAAFAAELKEQPLAAELAAAVARVRAGRAIENPEALAEGVERVAHTFWTLRFPERAEWLFRVGLGIRAAAFGATHPVTAAGWNNLGTFHSDQGLLELAASELRDAVKILQHHGRHDAVAASARYNLARVYQKSGRHAEAIALIQEALPDLIAEVGPEAEVVVSARSNLAFSLQKANRLTEAASVLDEAIAVAEKAFGAESDALKLLAAQKAQLTGPGERSTG